MTVLPLSTIPGNDGYRIIDRNGDEEAGGYTTKAEAEDIRLGLLRFYEEHPDYLILTPVSKEKNVNAVATEPLTVSRGEAIHLFQALGLKTADKWQKPRMQEKITKLLEDFEVDQKLADPEAQATFTKVSEAIVGNREIQLIADRDVSEGGEAAATDGPKVSTEAEKPSTKVEEELTDGEPEPKKEKAPKAEKPQKEPKPVAEPKKKYTGVRASTTTVPYLAGQVLKKHGLDNGITDEMVSDLAKLADNAPTAHAALAWAWHVARGFQGIE